VREELGARVRLEIVPQTYIVSEWQIADRFEVAASKKRLPPLAVILVPPRLGGPRTPDHLAILVYRTSLRDDPEPGDLLGLLRMEKTAVRRFFDRDEVPLEEAQADPTITIRLTGDLPDRAVLRPVLTARAVQILVRAGYDGLCA
jgi:hypothetical protein